MGGASAETSVQNSVSNVQSTYKFIKHFHSDLPLIPRKNFSLNMPYGEYHLSIVIF